MHELVPYTRFAAVVCLLLAAEEVGKTIHRVHFLAPANLLQVSTRGGERGEAVVVVLVVIAEMIGMVAIGFFWWGISIDGGGGAAAGVLYTSTSLTPP